MIPPSVESRNLHLFLRRPDDGMNSPFPGKDEKSSRVFVSTSREVEINSREVETNSCEDSGVFPVMLTVFIFITHDSEQRLLLLFA
jgi:hypothetical protein